ncbi:MAG: GNAT family N-acetyltransferase [Patescibacteria group bacterium]
MNTEESHQRPNLEFASKDGEMNFKQLMVKDTEDLFNLINESEESKAHLSQFGDTTAEKYTEQDKLRESILFPPNPKRLRLAIRSKEQGDAIIGSINLTPSDQNPRRAEIGYWLGHRYAGQRKGYMQRSVEALTDAAFLSGNFDELYAEVVEGNTASAKVLEKAGYTFAGTKLNDKKQTLLIYTKTYP